MLNINYSNKKAILSFLTISTISVILVTVIYLLAQNKITENKNNHQKIILNQLLQSKDIKFNNNILESVIYIKNKKLLNYKNYFPVYIAKYNNEITAIILQTIAPDGYNGNINILVAIKPDFNNIKASKIINIKVTDHEETPGLGDKADEDKYPEYSKKWLGLFKNKSLNNPKDSRKWAVRKDYNNAIIDSWTGATITPRAITKAVYNSLLFFEQNYKIILATKYQDKINF